MDNADVGLSLAALAGTYADIRTTKEAIKRGGVEANPLIGKNPSEQDLDKAGLLGAGLVGAATLLSKPEERKPVLGALAGLRFATANQNAHMPAKTKRTTSELAVQPLLGAVLGYALGSYLNDNPNVILAPTDTGRGLKLYINKTF